MNKKKSASDLGPLALLSKGVVLVNRCTLKPRPTAKQDGLRRVRLGHLRTVLRLRYGHTLPDDDAGREDLFELLLLHSMHPTHPVERMGREIEWPR